MSSEKPPLIAAAAAIAAPFDVVAAASETGLAHLPLEQLVDTGGLLWLTLAASRAGLGLPADPLRASGWLRFGAPVEEGEPVAIGDVVIVTVSEEPAAGILVSTDRGLHVQVGPEETVKAPRTRLVAARRPIAPAASERTS